MPTHQDRRTGDPLRERATRSSAPRTAPGSTSRTTAGTRASRSRPTAACASSRCCRRRAARRCSSTSSRWDAEKNDYVPATEAEAPARLPDGVRAGAWRCSRDVERRTSPRRAARCRSSCSSTTRSTARSAIRPASAASRTTGSSTSARASACTQEPVHKPKAVVFGPTIVYDAERCIVCTRCIRVSDEVAQGSGARHARARQPERDRRLARARSSTTTTR